MKLRLILRILFLLAGIFLICSSIGNARFYSDGVLQGSFAVVFSAGIALLILTFFPSRAGFWLALGLIGQSALLQTIDAGKRLHYQHYRPNDSNEIVLILLALQTILVLAGVWKQRSFFGKWIRSHPYILFVAPLLLLVGAAVSEDVSFFLRETLFVFLATLIQAGNLFLIVRHARKGFLLRKFFELVAGNHEKPNRFVIYACIWVFIASALLSIFVYERHPHVNDEVAYLFQARILSKFQLTLDPPPVPEAFQVYLFDYSKGRTLVVPPPGWPAILAAGVWLKTPWLINPLLAGLNVWLAFFVIHHLYGKRIARMSVLLLSVSPWFVFMGMNFMTHQLSTTCTLVCAAGVIQTRRTGKSGWSFLSGLFLGIQSLIRPLDAVVLGLLIGLWMIGLGGRRLKFASLVAFAIGTLTTALLIFPYNEYFTGDPFTYPINQYNEALFGKNANAYGFGKDHGMGWPLDPLPGHGPLAALINAQLNASQIQVELFGWSIGSLMFVFLLFLSGGVRRSDLPLLSVIAAVFIAYFFYYFSGGPDFGARYWFLMILPLVVLSARGMEHFQFKLDPSGLQIFAAVLVMALLTLCNYFPWRSVDKYHHYLNMMPEICSIQPATDHNTLIVVQGSQFPDYASAMACNPLDFHQGNPIYVWDKNPNVRRQVLEEYKDRSIWFVRGPSLTGRGYEIAP